MTEHVWDAPQGATGDPVKDEAAGLYEVQPTLDDVADAVADLETRALVEDDAKAGTSEPVSDEVPAYETWTVLELRDELRARAVSPLSGTKAELVERLSADDVKAEA